MMVEVLLEERNDVIGIIRLIGRWKDTLVGGWTDIVLVEKWVHWNLPQARERFSWTF